MRSVDIGLLGPLTVIGADGGARTLGPRDRVVLSALAVRAGEALPAERLADALWGQMPPASEQKVIQGCVMRLRKALGVGAIETTSGGYRLVTPDDALDIHRFERLLNRGREQVATGSPHRAVETLRQALALWRGRPFVDTEDWDPARHEAARLLELRRAAEEDLLAARLDAGEHADVAADAIALVAAEPWREQRWAVLALAQYRDGRQAEALATIRRARTRLSDQLGIDPGSDLVSLERAILQQDPDLAPTDRLGAASPNCPYKGLASYEADDSDVFFGREGEIASCLRRLDRTPLLVLAGPSGSGKSSLLRAGLVPVLAGSTRVALVVPGADPEAATAAARAAEPGDPILAVDQFEEAFTLGADRGSVRRWMADLAEYAATVAPVVVAVRADHLAGLSAEPRFASLAEDGLHLVAPLTGDALRAAIERPADLAGLRLEAGLIDLVLRDAEGEPGSLPLLSHALTETWRHREGRVLTVDGYRATGGIRGAVARTADRLYESLPLRQRDALRWTMLRLVSTTPEGEPVRTRVATKALTTDPERAPVVDLLVRARLATVEESTVELAHESLARAWPRLRSWLDDDAAGQRIRRHLTAAADGWEALGRPPSELYRGARLGAALEWAATDGTDVTRLEREFLAASEALAASERQQLVVRAREQARQNRRLRALLAGTAALLGIALIAGFVAVDSSRTARQERDAANTAQERSAHEALVNRSLALRATDRQVAALLAVEAYRQVPDALAHSALLSTFTASPGFMGYQSLPAEFFSNGTLIPGTSTAVLALDGRDLRLLDLDTREMTSPFPPTPRSFLSYSTLDVSADRRFVAQLVAADEGIGCGTTEAFRHHNARGCTLTAVYSLETGERMFGPVTTPFGGGDVALSPDGSLLAVTGGFNGDLAVYDVRTGRLVGVLEGLPRPPERSNFRDTGTVTFDAFGRLYLGSMAGPIREVDPSTLDVLRALPAPAMSSHNFLVLTSDGDVVAVGDDWIVALDRGTGRQLWSVPLASDEFSEECPFLGIAEALDRFYCGSYFGSIEERDLRTGQPTGVTMDSQLGSVGDLAVSPDGRELLAFSAGSPVFSRWRLDGGGPVTRLVAAGRVVTDGFVDGRFPVSHRDLLDTPGDTVAVWDPSANRPTATIPGATGGVWVDAETMAVLWSDGTPALYDLAERKRVSIPYAPADAVGLWRSPDGETTFVATAATAEQPTSLTIRALDAATMRPTGNPVTTRAWSVLSVSTTADRDRLVVTLDRTQGYVTLVFDLQTGEQLRTGLEGLNTTAVSSHDVLVGSAGAAITEYDLDTLEPITTYTGARGQVDSLQFSADGSRLLATSLDQTVQVYDVATGLRLGDPIESSSPDLIQGWLSPDGHQIAVNVPTGVAVWDIDAESLATAACRLAGRNLTQTEWDTYLRDVSTYRKTCPQFG